MGVYMYTCMAGAGGQLRVGVCTMYPPIGPHGMVWDGIGASGCSCTHKVSFLSSLAHFSFCLSTWFWGRDEEGRGFPLCILIGIAVGGWGRWEMWI